MTRSAVGCLCALLCFVGAVQALGVGELMKRTQALEERLWTSGATKDQGSADHDVDPKLVRQAKSVVALRQLRDQLHRRQYQHLYATFEVVNHESDPEDTVGTEIATLLAEVTEQDKKTVPWLYKNPACIALVDPYLDHQDYFALGHKAYIEGHYDAAIRFMRESLHKLYRDSNHMFTTAAYPPATPLSGDFNVVTDDMSEKKRSMLYAHEQYNYLHIAYFRTGRVAEAIEATKAALAIDPLDEQMQQNREYYEDYLLQNEDASRTPVDLAQQEIDQAVLTGIEAVVRGIDSTEAQRLRDEAKDGYLFMGFARSQVGEMRRLLEAVADAGLRRREEREHALGVPSGTVTTAGQWAPPPPPSVEEEKRWVDHGNKTEWDILAERLVDGRPTNPDLDATTPMVFPVDRRSNLSYEEFFTEYAAKSRPVIITDAMETMFRTNWTLDYLAETCFNATMFAQRFDPHSTAWGRLTTAKQMRVGEYIREFKQNLSNIPETRNLTQEALTGPLDSSGNPLLYLFDYPLPGNCDKIVKDFTIPKYFAGDLLQRIDKSINVPYRDSWPSLFVGPKGSKSALHVDSFGSNFWQALLAGRKKWRFFTPEESTLVYEDRAAQVFDIDTETINTTDHKLAKYAVMREAIIEPGELLFVPAGSPHQVMNMDNIIAISMNYVDASNIDRSVDMLHISAYAGFEEYRRLYNELSRHDFPANATRRQQDLHWDDFKTWPRSGEAPFDLARSFDKV